MPIFISASVIAAAQPKKSPAKRSYKPRKKKTAKKNTSIVAADEGLGENEGTL